jgi:hypothetical protein
MVTNLRFEETCSGPNLEEENNKLLDHENEDYKKFRHIGKYLPVDMV